VGGSVRGQFSGRRVSCLVMRGHCHSIRFRLAAPRRRGDTLWDAVVAAWAPASSPSAANRHHQYTRAPAVTIERIAGHDAPRPVEAGDQRRRGGQFGFRLFPSVVKRRLSEDDAEVMQHCAEHMHRIRGVIGAGETPPLRLTIEGDPVAATQWGLRGGCWRKVRSEDGGERERIEFAKEALHRRLVGRDASGEAKGGKESRRLTLSPLSDGEHREMVGEDGDHREGEDRSQRESFAVRTAGIGDARKGGEKMTGRKREHRRRGCL